MKLYLENWEKKFFDELPHTKKLKIISPFVTEKVLRKIQSRFDFRNFELITRYKLEDFAVGVSSLSGLKFSVENGANIYGIENLHSKIYLFDKRAAIVTSANLTNGGLVNNYECGIYTEDKALIQDLHNYFEEFKKIALFKKMTLEMCKDWEKKLAGIKIPKIKPNTLPDFGASKTSFDNTKNYYVKFFGKADSRAELNFPVVREIKSALCHYACCFPSSKKPRQVNEGDVVFMARMTKHPYDYAIFGKAIALKYTDGRDQASKQEIAERDWKKRWSAYLRVKDPVFIDGTMADGILLLDGLVSRFGYDSFQSTQENFNAGAGNVDPRKSIMRKAYVRLTHTSAEWLEQKFDEAVGNVGSVAQTIIKGLPQTTTDITAWKK